MPPDERLIADDVWACKTCGKGAEAHSLAEAIAHIYGGAPSVSGRDFDAEESEEVADRILGRLLNDG